MDWLKIVFMCYGVNFIVVEGRVGVLFIVIEDDFIIFMQADSVKIFLEIKEVMFVSDSLELQLVVIDSLMLIVYNFNYLVI